MAEKGEKDLTQTDLILYLHAASAFQLLRAGVEFGLFEYLHKKKSTGINGPEKHLPLKPGLLRCILFGLTALNLIECKKSSWKNNRVIEDLFLRNEWPLFRSMVMIQAYIMYPGQQDFVESLKKNTNIGIKRFRGRGKTIYERLNYNPKLKEIFYDYMENYSAYANKELLKNVDFSQDFNILDVGGGGGINAIAIAESNPNSMITLLDLPLIRKIAIANIKKNKLERRIKFFSSDFFKDEFPQKQDCVLFIHQLVIWSPTQNKKLLGKAYRALKKGGKVVIFSSMAENNEKGPLMAALDTVYFKAVAAGRGMIYPWKDYKKILCEIGFKKIEFIRCNTWTPHGIVIGYK